MDTKSVVDVCSSIGRIHQQRRSNNQWNRATKRLAFQCKETPLTWCREVTSVRPVLGKRQLRTDLQELRSDIGQLSNTEYILFYLESDIGQLQCQKITVRGVFDNLLEFFVKQSWFIWSVIIWRSICINCFSSWFVVQILFEVDTLSEVWCVIELYVVSFVRGCLRYWWNRCTTIYWTASAWIWLVI